MKLEDVTRQVIACRRCPRLVQWREAMAIKKRKAYRDMDYWGKPVPGFGDPQARVLVVGLAPGAHGSNRTGRQFTGDASGSFLYPALFRAGFASQAESVARDDKLTLRDLYITAAARCAPPDNKPTAQELANCQPYLESEIQLIQPKVIVCLGRIAFATTLRLLSLPVSKFKFAHGASYKISLGTGAAELLADLLVSPQPTKYADRQADNGHVRPHLGASQGPFHSCLKCFAQGKPRLISSSWTPADAMFASRATGAGPCSSSFCVVSFDRIAARSWRASGMIMLNSRGGGRRSWPLGRMTRMHSASTGALRACRFLACLIPTTKSRDDIGRRSIS